MSTSSTMTNVAAGAGGLASVTGTAAVTGMGIAEMQQGFQQQQAFMAASQDIQNKTAMLNMATQLEGLARSTAVQGVRDYVKDAKDSIKDAGDAGHKPS